MGTAETLRGELRSTTRSEADVVSAGTTVEVHCRFDQRWTPGFTVVDVSEQGCRIRRTSDGCVLPAWFPLEQVRPLRRGPMS